MAPARLCMASWTLPTGPRPWHGCPSQQALCQQPPLLRQGTSVSSHDPTVGLLSYVGSSLIAVELLRQLSGVHQPVAGVLHSIVTVKTFNACMTIETQWPC